MSEQSDVKTKRLGRSFAIILRSAKLGEITQNQYDPETGEIRPGPGPTQIPFELTA